MDILAEALDWRMFPEPWHHPPYERGFRLRCEYALRMGRRLPAPMTPAAQTPAITRSARQEIAS